MRIGREQAAAEGDDRELMKRSAAGCEVSFTALYRRHQGAIFRFAYHMSGSAETAEEVTQETFLQLIRNPGGYQAERGSFIAFLYGIARNQALRFLERERPYASGLDDGEFPAADALTAADDGLRDLLLSEQVEALRLAVAGLPAPYREVIVLCELHELDYEETAVALGCPIGTVRSRLHRARALLAWRLNGRGRCLA